MIKNLLYMLIAFTICCLAPTSVYALNEATAIDTEMQQVKITVSAQGSISIYGAKGQVVYIYNVLGVKIASCEIDSNEKRIDLSLANGCYIVKVGNTARKIFIKR